MGHQSPERPNQPSTLVLLPSHHVWAHLKRPSHWLSANERWHLWTQDLPEFTPVLRSCGLILTSPHGLRVQIRQKRAERQGRPRKTSTNSGHMIQPWLLWTQSCTREHLESVRERSKGLCLQLELGWTKGEEDWRYCKDFGLSFQSELVFFWTGPTEELFRQMMSLITHLIRLKPATVFRDAEETAATIAKATERTASQ